MKIFYKIFYEISYHTFWNIDPKKSKIFYILYDLLWLIESIFILFLKKIYVYNIFVYIIYFLNTWWKSILEAILECQF